MERKIIVRCGERRTKLPERNPREDGMFLRFLLRIGRQTQKKFLRFLLRIRWQMNKPSRDTGASFAPNDETKDLFAFQIHITEECDQRCEHCYIFAENNDVEIRRMSFDQMIETMNNCMDMCRKLNRDPYFYITGGDPILHRDFWKFLEVLSENNIRFSIMGNPFHLNGEVCRRLSDLGCEKYQLSIDGMRETHDSIRKKGSFDATIEKIKDIRSAGMDCAIMTTVSGLNAKEMPDIIDTVVKNHADIFSFSRYCPTGNGKSVGLTPEEYREVLDACWKRFELHKESETWFDLKDHLWTLYLFEKGIFRIPDGLEDDVIYDGCNCGNCHLTILPDGNVYACRRMESPVGNAFTESLYDIFTGDRMDRYRMYSDFKKCSKCELLRFCRGCPAVAFGGTGDFYSADPQCWKVLP